MCTAGEVWLQAIVLKTYVTNFRLVLLSRLHFMNTLLNTKHQTHKEHVRKHAPTESLCPHLEYTYLHYTWEMVNSARSLFLEHNFPRNKGYNSFGHVTKHLVTRISPRKHGFEPGNFNVGMVVDMETFYLTVCRFFPAVSVHQCSVFKIN
jgi:hypothetical protein